MEKMILYKLATRSRPERFKETLNSIVNNSSNNNYMVLVSIDDDDESMQKVSKEIDHPNVVFISGVSYNKIHAINRDIEKASDYADWKILVNISDDMLITSKDFDNVVRSAFEESLDIFLHLPDGFTDDKLATMSIMGKAYYERFNFIYHPSYKSVWCDNEAMDVAKKTLCYRYLPQQVFVHNHPANIGNVVWDEQYARTEAYEMHRDDNLNYETRKLQGFPN